MLSLSVAQNENEDTTMLSLSVAQNENEDTTKFSLSVAQNEKEDTTMLSLSVIKRSKRYDQSQELLLDVVIDFPTLSFCVLLDAAVVSVAVAIFLVCS